MPEAEIRTTDEGSEPAGEGWFVLNVADARGLRHETAGIYARFESNDARFSDFGINIHVLQPGEPNALYHQESAQEDFLVLSGECLLIVEDEERTLKQWDFFHSPAGTPHVFVGAGDGPCAILMVGTRDDDETLLYPVSETALKHNAGVETETASGAEAYSIWPSQLKPERMPWPPPTTKS
jgi:uncharacterized cupin superfamily protein